MASFTDPAAFRVGARCVSDDYFGTIRYVGDVPPAEGRVHIECATIGNVVHQKVWLSPYMSAF